MDELCQLEARSITIWPGLTSQVISIAERAAIFSRLISIVAWKSAATSARAIVLIAAAIFACCVNPIPSIRARLSHFLAHHDNIVLGANL